MFDDGPALELDARSEQLLPPTMRCEACGRQNPAGYNYCSDCGARTEGTLAYGAVVHLTLAAEWFGRAAVTDVRTPVPGDEAAERATLRPANDAASIDTVCERVDSLAAPTGDSARGPVDSAWVQLLDALSCTPAELVWDSLASEDVTAVWSADERPSACASEPASDERVELPATVDTEVAPSPRIALLVQLAPDGYPGQGTPLAAELVPCGGAIDIGRACARFGTDDPYLEPWHARLSSHADGLQLHEQETRGGVWMRLTGPRWLRDGDRFRIGGTFVCFDAALGLRDLGRRSNGERGRIQLMADGERIGLALAICDATVLGRAGTDVVLSDDPFVSVAHCRVVPGGDGVQLEDLGSSNGTWVRLRCGDVIPFGALVAIGQSVYRVEPVDG